MKIYTMDQIKSVLKTTYNRLLKIKGTPKAIALGFALGIFIGMTPTFGLHMALAVFFAMLFNWNKLSAVIGVWITNPATAVFIYSINYLVGAKLLGMQPTFRLSEDVTFSVSMVYDLIYKTPEIIAALTLGGVVLGLPLAFIGYYAAFYAVEKYQNEIKEKLVQQKTKLVQKRNLRKQTRAKRKQQRKERKRLKKLAKQAHQ